MASAVVLPMSREVKNLVPEHSSSTLLELQLRRRDRRNKHFLLNVSGSGSGSGSGLAQGSASSEADLSPVQNPAPSPSTPPAPKTGLELSAELEQWIKQMENWDSRELRCNDLSGRCTMSSLISKDAPTIEPYPSLDKLAFTYQGGRDKERKFHGRGSLEFDNGCSMSGEWKNGEREGKFRMDADDKTQVCFLECFYVKNKIQGKVCLQFSTGVWVSGYAKDSVLHGFCKYYSPDKKLTHAGMTRNGKLFGTCWKFLPGGGLVVGRVDSEGEFSGPNIAYIYPDFSTGLLGVFKEGDMVTAQAVTLQDLRTEYNCIKVPVFSTPKEDIFRLEKSTTTWLTENTMLEDPYEKLTVYVKTSNTPGASDGLFAARDLKCNTIAAFYNGIRKQRPPDSASTWQDQDNAYKIFDPTNKTGVIDILPKHQV
ncbi:histone-lysine N-methyltransferase SETD7 [Eurytemora carolleeae]|uniref:histone-lysine N-methyltransferase SETD7 n=1 Tax=Eurytemora carolleeae TaxID=1294199 RepID=UPI000C771244|nr:histone-lysine N-methyltransferase SETD7 [Eurytemora carolleeae]|eukprot:XP_023343893.1 histone-lysine N-methyltransferase SETD7-like [Eurytemora affinis]